MFKIITRAKANPAKREPFAFRTQGKKNQEGTLYHRAKLWILLNQRNNAVYVVEFQKRKLQTRNHAEMCCHIAF
jgi:hypothetical protein